MDQLIQQKVAEIASHVERQLDSEIEKLDNLNIDDIEKLREKRLQEMKKMQHQKQIWISLVFICFIVRQLLDFQINVLFVVLYRVMENIQN